MIIFNHVSKSFEDGNGKRVILKDSTIVFEEKKISGIIGRSGLGKTTLLKMILGLINADEGFVEINGVRVKPDSPVELEHLRRNVTGCVFQNFNLISSLTVEENILLPTYFNDSTPANIHRLLDLLGLPKSILTQSVNTVSGGEKQRIAIARALINNPRVLLADEPTGNLDLQNENAVIELFKRINQELGLTILLVTHSQNMALNADKLYTIRDYILVETQYM